MILFRFASPRRAVIIFEQIRFSIHRFDARSVRAGEARFEIMTALVILVYGILTAAGGVFAYMKVGSRPSLIAGGVSGLLLVVAAIAMMRGAYQPGWWVALVITLLLLGRFVYASIGNFKFMPGGLMIALSVVALAALLFGRTSPAP